MKLAQIYASADQILQDMGAGKRGDFPGLSDHIKAASTAIQGMLGTFIPVIETRTFYVDHFIHHDQALGISPLLDVVSIAVNDAAMTDFVLQPIQRHWPNGPYTMLERKPTYQNGYRVQDQFVDYTFYKGDKIDITGSWGLYEELDDIALTITQATSTEKTLVTTNGSLVSPGMVLLSGSEQEFVSAGNGSAGSPAPTMATSLLNMSGGIEDSGSIQIITVDNGAEFFEGEVLRIDSEDLYIERIAGNDLTVERGWNQSIIANHLDNVHIYVYRTYTVQRGVNGTTAAAHTATALQQYIVPDDLNYLCRQITVLMIKKADSGFQGRVGSAETGDAMYFSEFPPNQIKAIKDNYSL